MKPEQTTIRIAIKQDFCLCSEKRVVMTTLPKGQIIMSPQSKGEYREAVHLRYKNGSRHEKTAILDECRGTPPVRGHNLPHIT